MTGLPQYGSTGQDLVASPTPLVLAPGESIDCSFDFSTLPLLTGEYVATVVSTTVAVGGALVAGQTLITNVAVAPGIAPTKVVFRVTQPALDVDYLVTFTVTTQFTGTSGASETRQGVFWVLGRAA
jgi:hypothetical protein